MANKGLAHKRKIEKFKAKHPEGRKEFARTKAKQRLDREALKRSAKKERHNG